MLDELMPAQSKRQKMSEKGEALVDGTGAPAVVAAILRSDREHV
jgi:hypothetical protein